jgi:hypothetical protein
MKKPRQRTGKAFSKANNRFLQKIHAMNEPDIYTNIVLFLLAYSSKQICDIQLELINNYK